MDKRSITSATNGKLGGRPKELENFEAMPDENWRPIRGYSQYFVSDHGRVLTTKYNKIKLVKVHNCGGGYKRVNLCSNNKRSLHRVHRLVLFAFKGECPKGCEGSHLDGDRWNSHINNLIWETPVENTHRKQDHGTQQRGEQMGTAKLTAEDVETIKRLSSNGVTCTKIALSFPVDRRHIGRIVRGERWAHAT